MTGTAAAQITLQTRQPLAFGVTLPGVNKSIAPSNAISAGQYYLLEHLGGVVKLTFTLPTNLVKSGGGNLSITFLTTDANYVTTGSSSSTTVFSPKTAKTVTLSTSPDIYVNIGGTIRPTALQATGTYTGTITLTITVIS